jgi:hypothetical protein
MQLQPQQQVAAQANNCYVFPGLALGCIASRTTQVNGTLLLAAAAAIAGKTLISSCNGYTSWWDTGFGYNGYGWDTDFGYVDYDGYITW